MKKAVLSLLIAATGLAAQAQIGQGGIPMSLQTELKDQYVPVSHYALPDWESTLAKNERAEASGKPQPYLLGLFTPSNVTFPSSGSIVKTENGHTIWRAQISIEGAKAVGLYYDKFQLPKGVKYFISNANRTQILGAYTAENNAPSKAFANEAVQGSVVNLEMDIEPGVDISKIEFHIDRSAVYFRGVEHLVKFAIDPDKLHEIDEVDTALSGRSSVCMINAICPLGVNYATPRRATLQTVLITGNGIGLCSASMVNSAGNTTSNCKQYVLTATHCDPANSTSSAHFDQMLMRFNFEQATCNGTAIPESNTIVGANFIARANYDDNAPISNMKGDFMLLELRQSIPLSWNVNLAGWNKNPNLPTMIAAPKKYIGFHHPDGDVKKVSSAQVIESGSLDGTSGPNGTHWAMMLDSGFVSTGSSGSGLFDGDGYLIGIASVAGAANVPGSCNQTSTGASATAMDFIAYSKFAYDWDYSIDGTANNRKLKPWLDPNNTGVVTVNPVKSNCTPIDGGGTGIITNNNLDNAINVYPNPNTTGKVNVQINLSETSDLSLELYDVTGKNLKIYSLKNVRSGNYQIDLGNVANGMYLLKCSDGTGVTSKKIMLSK